MAILPPELESIFRESERNEEPVSRHTILDSIYELREKKTAICAKVIKAFIAELTAFELLSQCHRNGYDTGDYYEADGFLFELDDNGCESLRNGTITPSILDYWQSRSQEASHPFLRILYADLVWDLSRRVLEKGASIRCAQTVVDSSVELANRRLFKLLSTVRKKLARALSVAQSIKDQARLNQVVTAIITLEDEIAEPDKPGTWCFGFDLLLKPKRIPVAQVDEQRIIDRLEDNLARAAKINADLSLPHSPRASKEAAFRLAHYYRRKSRPDDIRRVLVLYTEAVKAMARKSMTLLCMQWLQEAFAAFLQYGMKDEADAVAVLMREIGPGAQEEMTCTTHSMKISEEEIGRFTEQMMTGTEDEVVEGICQLFIPNSAKIEERLRDMAANSVLMGLFSQSSIDKEGREVSRVGSVKDDPEGHLVLEMGREMQFHSFWLKVSLQEWVKRFNLTTDRLLERLQRSPLFASGHKDVLKAGLNAFLQGNHIAAVHILLPQIECAFRSLLVLTEKNTLRLRRDGGAKLKLLDELLRDPATKEIFGENQVRYFQSLLTDARGWNLRNNVCHGLIETPSTNPVFSNRIIHILLVLSMVKTP